eukprot:scaffold101729_cov32-Attheya_sp.AAC.1
MATWSKTSSERRTSLALCFTLFLVGIWAWDGTGLGGIPLEETGVVGVVDIFAEDTCVKGIITSSVGGFTVSGLVSDGGVDIFAEDTCVKGITTSSVEGFTVSEL